MKKLEIEQRDTIRDTLMVMALNENPFSTFVTFLDDNTEQEKDIKDDQVDDITKEMCCETCQYFWEPNEKYTG